MLIFEIENSDSIDTNKLASLTQWLSGIAGDNNSKKEISVATFVNLAKNLGINITAGPQGNLDQLIALRNLSTTSGSQSSPLIVITSDPVLLSTIEISNLSSGDIGKPIHKSI